MTKIDHEGKTYDLTRVFIDDEYLLFPVCAHDDMLDCMARITETEALSLQWPTRFKPADKARDPYAAKDRPDPYAWMTA